MCGNVGVAGDIGRFSSEMFENMLELDIIRGRDSTGVMIKNDDGAHVIKELDVPFVGLYNNEDYLTQIESKTNNIIIGHNRAATIGEVTVENAHPFKRDHIIGCHNGTLTSRYQLEDHKKFTVDSENIFHHMSLHGVEDTIAKLQGAFALVWYNEEDETLNFIRNRDRTLFFAFDNRKECLYWASEVWMMDRAAKKARVTLGQAFTFEPFAHYSIKVPARDAKIREKEFGKFRVRRLKKYSYHSHGNHQAGRNGVNISGGNRQQPYSSNRRHLSRLHTHGNNPFPSGNSVKRLSDYSKHEIVDFFLYGQRIMKGTVPYIYGQVVGNPDIEVRICPVKSDPLWKQSMSGRFRGMVKKNKNGYLLLAVSTVQRRLAVDNTPKKEPDGATSDESSLVSDLYTIGNGRMVNHRRLLEILGQGCSICASPVFIEDLGSIQWLDNQPVCAGCDLEPYQYMQMH